jgi:beta-xylosidase
MKKEGRLWLSRRSCAGGKLLYKQAILTPFCLADAKMHLQHQRPFSRRKIDYGQMQLWIDAGNS